MNYSKRPAFVELDSPELFEYVGSYDRWTFDEDVFIKKTSYRYETFDGRLFAEFYEYQGSQIYGTAGFLNRPGWNLLDQLEKHEPAIREPLD